MNSHNTDINRLLKKYNKNYVPGEKRSREYNNKQKQISRQKDKEETAKDLFQEVPFHLTQTDKEQVIHLIRMYPNFRKLHGKAENETIILAFIFYVKLPYNKKIRLDKEEFQPILSKYKLTHNTFEIIICRLTLQYLKNVYIIPTIPKDKSHEILQKNGNK